MRVARRTVLGAGLGVGAMAWPGFAGAQSAAPRFGLVVGNTAYNRGVGELRNAGADADLVAQSLRACGFSVPNDAVVKNVARLPLMAAVRAHVARVQAAGPQAVGFLYYAGHGAAASTGRNYLIPIVSAEEMTDALWDECVDLPWLFNTLGASPHAHIVALDACRNSLRTPDRSPGNATYRNVVAEGREHNTFISYSTWEGQTASDGVPGATNGPYALALAAHMGLEGRSVIDMFDVVRRDVRARTQNIQEPMNLSRLSDTSSSMRIARVSTPPAVVAPQVRADAPSTLRAFVISCDYGGGLPALMTTRRSADRVADAFERSGFTVMRSINPTRTEMMQRHIRLFREELTAAGPDTVAAVYFAGYAASYNGANYLLPQDARVETDGELELAAVPLSFVIEQVAAARAQFGVAMLDCGRRFSPNVSPRGIQPYLVDTMATRRFLLSFSAVPGQLAIDTPEGSIFSLGLVEEMLRPERRDFVRTMAAVADNVFRRTDGAQMPFYQYSAGPAPVYFRAEAH